MTNKNIVCGYIDCDEPRATSWGWITASNGLDSLNFCSSDHYDTWIEKNAGNFWDLKGLGTDAVTFGPTTIKQEDDGKIEYTCSLSSHITDENKQAIIQSLMTQFQGFHMNPVIVAPQDSYSFKITLDKGEMSPSEIKDKLLWNYFIDKVTTRTDAKLLKNLHVDFNKQGSGEGGFPLECYRCGATGSNDKFGYGWQRKCPHCGSYEIHLDRDHEKPAPCMICEKDAKELEEYKKIWKEASTNDLTDTVISLSKNNSPFQGNYAKEKIQWVPIDIVHEMREFDRGGKDAYSGSRDKIDDIKNSLPKNGFMNPLIVDYSMKDRHAYLCEGNHRLIAAQEIGLTHVPVRIIKKENSGNKNRGYAKPVTGVDPDNYGYVPADMSPSQVGMVKENDIIKNTSVNGQGYDAPVDSNFHAPGAQDPEGPQYIIDQANITGPQVEASLRKSHDELPLPDYVEDENKHQSIANYLKWKYNWNEMDRFGRPISDYSSSDTNKNLSILHGFTTDAWGDKCTCPLCSFARKVPSGPCSSCDRTYDQSLGDRVYILRPGTNSIKKDVWTYNPETNDYKCPNCIKSIKTASFYDKPTDAEKKDARDKGIYLDHYSDSNDYNCARQYGATHKEILDAHDKGVGLSYYAEARNSGVTHKEILDAHSKGVYLRDYANARDAGATHKEILDANDKGIDFQKYVYAREYGATHNEIIDADNKGIGLRDYADARDVGTTHDEILDGHDKDFNLNDYAEARRKGITHKEIIDAKNKGISLYLYSKVKNTGATHKEIIDAKNKGIGLSKYGDARYNGITHNEILDAHSEGINLNNYNIARYNGITHNEILDAHSKGIDIDDYDDYGNARRSGATHNEIIDAHDKRVDLPYYNYARRYGATHKETLDAHNKGIDLSDYGYAREYGATHNQILNADSKGVNLSGYGLARAYGATHNEILDAHNKGLNLYYYTNDREYANHEEAILEQIPNYNPYKEIFGKSSSKISSIEPTRNEILDVHDKGIDIVEYGDARNIGATHKEILDANDKGINLSHYGIARESGATHKETLEAHNKGINLSHYGNARYNGATHNQILDADSKGINLDDYFVAIRNGGATHKEIMSVHNKGLDLRYYAYTREYGATHNEIIDADNKGLNLRDYGIARNNGATHNEILDAKNKGLDSYQYGLARYNGSTHNEILDSHNKGIYLNDYGLARDSGATHNETLDAHNKNIDLRDYSLSRDAGVTHNEALDADNKGIELSYYNHARGSGATHNEVLDAHNKGIGLDNYGHARKYGATHKEILDAHDKGLDLYGYANDRVGGNNHEEAILEQIPDYNPYKEIFGKKSSIHEATPYHVSPDYNRESIEEHGLQPNRPHHDWDWEKQWDPGMNVFLSPTADDASTWARQIQSTWRDEEDSDDSGREYPHYFDLYHVNTEDLSGVRPGMTDLGKEELVSKAPISPDRITHIKTFDPWYKEEEEK